MLSAAGAIELCGSRVELNKTKRPCCGQSGVQVHCQVYSSPCASLAAARAAQSNLLQKFCGYSTWELTWMVLSTSGCAIK